MTAGIHREIARAAGTLANGTISYCQLNYASYKRVRAEVWGALTPGHAPRLFFAGVSPSTLKAVVFPDNSHLGLPTEAVTLDVRWDVDKGRFVWVVAPMQEAVERHARSLRCVVEALPDGATVAGTDPRIYVLNSSGDTPSLKALLPAGSIWIPCVAKSRSAESEWIVIDTADPRLLIPVPGAWAWDLLVGAQYGLVFENHGLYVFRRGGDPGLGRELLAERGLPFREFLTHGTTGRDEAEPEATFGFARWIRAWRDTPGTLLEPPLPELRPAQYEALVRFRCAEAGIQPALDVRISVGADGPVLAERKVTLSGSAQGRWEEAVLGFTVGERIQAGAPLRVTALGPGDVALDAPRLRVP